MSEKAKAATRPYTVLVEASPEGMTEGLAEGKSVWIEMGTVVAANKRAAINEVLSGTAADDTAVNVDAIANFTPETRAPETIRRTRWKPLPRV